MKTPDKLEIAYAMQRRGSQFVKALSHLIVLSNEGQLDRIREAFPEIWREHEERAALTIRKEGEDRGR